MTAALQLVTGSRTLDAMAQLVERAKALGVPDTLEPGDDGPGLVLEIPEETVQQITSKLLAAKQGQR